MSDKEIELFAERQSGWRFQYGQECVPTFPRNNHEPYEDKVKVDLPHFDRHLDIEDFLDWIQNVENLFDYMDIPMEKSVKFLAHELKGGAAAWWRKLQETRHPQGKMPFHNWYRMNKFPNSQFLPPDFQKIYQQYQICHQGSKTVARSFTGLAFLWILKSPRISKCQGISEGSSWLFKIVFWRPLIWHIM